MYYNSSNLLNTSYKVPTILVYSKLFVDFPSCKCLHGYVLDFVLKLSFPPSFPSSFFRTRSGTHIHETTKRKQLAIMDSINKNSKQYFISSLGSNDWDQFML